RLDEEDIRMHAARDSHARAADTAGIAAITRREAVQRLRDRDRRRTRIRSGLSGKDQARRKRVPIDRSREEIDQPSMARDVAEWHPSTVHPSDVTSEAPRRHLGGVQDVGSAGRSFYWRGGWGGGCGFCVF